MTKEHLAPDVLSLLRSLHDHGARYLLVGGEAVTWHGYPRFTGDVDLFYDRAPAGARAVYAGLLAFWGGTDPLVSGWEELAQPGVILQYGRPPNRIDLLSSLAAVEFDEAWATRQEDVVHTDPAPFPLAILSLPLLVRNKRAAARPKDLDDAEQLERIAASKARRG